MRYHGKTLCVLCIVDVSDPLSDPLLYMFATYTSVLSASQAVLVFNRN